MDNNSEKALPSDDIQKEYEVNPSKILEKIRENDNNSKSISKFKTYCQNQFVEDNSKGDIIDIYNLYNFDEQSNQTNSGIYIDYTYNNNIDRQSDKYYKNNNIFDNIKKPQSLNTNNFIDNNNLNNNKNNFPIDINNIQPNFLFNINKLIEDENNKSIIYYSNKILEKLTNCSGSIFLQKILLTLNSKEISILLFNILSSINNIMCLEYGNYFFQKLIKRLNMPQRILIYQKIEPYFLLIAQNQSGTHSIQSIIDEIQTPYEQEAFNSLLNKNMLFLFNNENAYHIIMKIIMEKPENQRNNINLFLIYNIEKIAINQYGSYCINKFIVYNKDIKLRNLLLENIHFHIKDLFYHKCSCSVLLLLLKYYKINSCEFIFSEIEKNLIELIKCNTSYIFVCKIFSYVKNNNKDILNSIILNIYKNEELLKTILSNKNGEQLLNKLTGCLPKKQIF